MSAAKLQQAASRLVVATGAAKARTVPQAKGAKAGAVSTGRPSSGGTGSGSSLAESDFTLRQYWPTVNFSSSDGLFTVQVQPIKSINLGGSKVLTFKQPV